MTYISAGSVHYTVGQLQIYDYYMSAVCIHRVYVTGIRHMSPQNVHYTVGQFQIYDCYMSAVCIHLVYSYGYKTYVTSKCTLYSGTVTNI